MNGSDTNNEHDGGFVLMEVLVALFIIGIAAVSFLQIASFSADRAAQLRLEHEMDRLADQILAQERLKPFAEFREEQGLQDGLAWDVTVSPVPGTARPNAEQPELAQIKISVHEAGRLDGRTAQRIVVLPFGQGR